MILREHHLKRIKEGLDLYPVVMILGPRQCGKTTLARQLVDPSSANYFDLEDPLTAELLSEQKGLLSDLQGLVVLDEVQRIPSLFPALRVLADRPDNDTRFLLLGSASPELKRQASESLAGRVDVIEIRGFDLREVGAKSLEKAWLRGGYPRSYLARSEMESAQWRRNFIRTFVERDIGNLGFGVSPRTMSRFWRMASHYHGQIWNASEIARSMGFSQSSARNYIDALEESFMVRRLEPYFVNIKKRLVRSPKFYLRDSGLFHTLQNIHSKADLLNNPKLGPSWEGFVIEQLIGGAPFGEHYFYAAQSAAELDLLIIHEGKRVGFEIKRKDAPKITRSMRSAFADLDLDRLYIIYPGSRELELEEGYCLLPASALSNRSSAHIIEGLAP